MSTIRIWHAESKEVNLVTIIGRYVSMFIPSDYRSRHALYRRAHGIVTNADESTVTVQIADPSETLEMSHLTFLATCHILGSI